MNDMMCVNDIDIIYDDIFIINGLMCFCVTGYNKFLILWNVVS